jgi:cystathionine gamma-lyase
MKNAEASAPAGYSSWGTLTPYFQKPLELGADIVVHSATKYMGGHSDVLGGAVMTNNDGLYKRIKFNQNAIGAGPSPFDCYLTMRGIKTLALRMEQHQKNALSIAQWLENHKKVIKVIYPGLENHPQHGLIKNQASGYGGMISFEIEGKLKDARAFLSKLKIISLAESLGGVESLIEHPGLMTHSSLSAEQRNKIGISDTLIRFSVGIEDEQDLIDDLAQAM